MEIEIVNLRERKKVGYEDVEIVDRTTILGNPYKVGVDGTRLEVVEMYRPWLWDRIREKGAVWNELVRLYEKWQRDGRLVLACWCVPEKCHAEIIKDALIWIHTTRLMQIKS